MPYQYLNDHCGNCTSSQEQGEESLAECFSDIPPYVLSRLNLTASKSCCNGSETESCQSSQYGTISGHSTERHGVGESMSSAADSLAKTLALVEEEKGSPENVADSGLKWHGWFAKYNLDTSSWRIAQCSFLEDLELFSGSFTESGIMLNGECFQLAPLEQRMSAADYGLLPTPVKLDAVLHGALVTRNCEHKLDKNGIPRRYLQNGNSGSLGLARLYLLLTGELLPPEESENLMMWPIGWTDLRPLETDKFQAWLLSHGAPLPHDQPTPETK